MVKMQVELHSSIGQIPAHEWNALNRSGSPFLRHEFLSALELSESVCADTGWQPCHVEVRDKEQRLVAVMPCYVKSHSYGEYVFDHSWANAYQRAGRDYYPKLLSAIPFSPVGGERLLIAEDITDTNAVFSAVLEKLQTLANSINASSWHVLFPNHQQVSQLSNQGLQHRIDCQYHWFNDEFSNFDEFLSSFASRKRKNIRKERKRVAEQGVKLKQLHGSDISAQNWEDFYQFYHMTYYKRGGAGYLNREFFDLVAATMPEQLVMVVAEQQGAAVGAALCFKDSTTLYGRYWGCAQEFDFLHFEACYYQGIDYCIRNGLQRFDPGAQGEHKIQRGFIPVFTSSCHWFAEEDFAIAIERFLGEEKNHIEDYRLRACESLPFNQNYLDQTQHQSLLQSGK